MNKRSTHGFTLIEFAVATAMVGVLVAVAVPMFYKLERQTYLRASTREVMGHLQKARGLAASGRTADGWGADDHCKSAVFTIVSDRSYQIAIDRDLTENGDEVVVDTINYDRSPNNPVKLGPVGTQIRFRGNGTVVAPENITVTDSELGETRTIVISGGGKARVE